MSIRSDGAVEVRSLCLWALLATFAVLPVNAQPRAVELFGTVGHFRYAVDSGFEGSGAVVGGTATLPIVRTFAIELEGHTSDIEFKNRFRYQPDFYSQFGPIYTASTKLFGITPVVRFGNEKVYGFGGLGPAATIRDGYGTGFFQVRGGVVVRLVRHFVLRAEYVHGTRGYSPATGVKAGFGYRF